MCGRFIATTPGKALARLFELDDEPDISPRYNVAPGQPILIVRSALQSTGGRRRHETARPMWGYTMAAAGKRRFVINARSETVAELPTFRDDFRSRRIVVPADGWYEWRKDPVALSERATRGVPHLVRPEDGRPFAFAGLLRSAGSESIGARHPSHPDAEIVILTTRAASGLEWLHDRMPARVALENVAAWLDPRVTRASAALALLEPPDDGRVTVIAVTDRVSRVANDDELCIELAEESTRKA